MTSIKKNTRKRIENAGVVCITHGTGGALISVTHILRCALGGDIKWHSDPRRGGEDKSERWGSNTSC